MGILLKNDVSIAILELHHLLWLVSWNMQVIEGICFLGNYQRELQVYELNAFPIELGETAFQLHARKNWFLVADFCLLDYVENWKPCKTCFKLCVCGGFTSPHRIVGNSFVPRWGISAWGQICPVSSRPTFWRCRARWKKSTWEECVFFLYSFPWN